MGFIIDIIVGLVGSMFGEAWADRRAARRQESGRSTAGCESSPEVRMA